MNADIFAEWLRRQGYHVIRTASSYWYNQGPFAYQAFPYHWLITPSAEELNNIFKSSSGVTLRYSTPLSAAAGCISYHAIYDLPVYDFSALGRKARNDVRRGLKECTFSPISWDSLENFGWELLSDTLKRQGRECNFDKNYWQTICKSANKLPGFEAWGVYVRNVLTACLISFQMENYMYILFQQSDHNYFYARVNNVLCYETSQMMLHRTDISCLFYGLHSLDAPSSVDEFKFRMGYSPKPVRQRVVFNPYLRPFVNQMTHRWVKRLLSLKPGNALLAKTEGMIRFYLQGQKSLTEQTWPLCLAKDKEKIILLERGVSRLESGGTKTREGF